METFTKHISAQYITLELSCPCVCEKIWLTMLKKGLSGRKIDNEKHIQKAALFITKVRRLLRYYTFNLNQHY
jgi:hypothetical protein